MNQPESEEVWSSFASSFSPAGAAAVAQLYTDDAVLMPADGTFVEGPAAIGRSAERRGRGVRAGGGRAIDTHIISTHRGGNLEVVVGRYALDVEIDGGGSATENGHYVVVYRHEEDGGRRLVIDISTVEGLPHW